MSALRDSAIVLPSEERSIDTFHEQQLLYCHDPKYVQYVAHTCENLKLDEIITLSTGDVEVSRYSYFAAAAAVNAAVCAIDAIATHECQRAFVVARPPGHHAERNRGMGLAAVR
jgi:acetoin utilization deacetylase AcuC-like enzyme